jgi:hypothetical protein
MRFLGIDPGNEGAMALIGENDKIELLFQMPREQIHMVKQTKVKGIKVDRKVTRYRIDWLTVWAWLRKNVPNDGSVIVGIETLIVPMMRQSNTQNIINYGRLLMLLELGRWPYREVGSRRWQKSFDGMFPFSKIVPPEGADKKLIERIRRENYQKGKERLIKVANYLFHPPREITSGEADSLLLARHLWEEWVGKQRGGEQLKLGADESQ